MINALVLDNQGFDIGNVKDCIKGKGFSIFV